MLDGAIRFSTEVGIRSGSISRTPVVAFTSIVRSDWAIKTSITGHRVAGSIFGKASAAMPPPIAPMAIFIMFLPR